MIFYINVICLFGTPEYVIDKIKELKSVNLNLQNLQVWSNFPGMSNMRDCMKSIKLFTEKVMPHFQR